VGICILTSGSGLSAIAHRRKTQTDVVCPQSGEMMEEAINLRAYIPQTP
jgi:hypothetical protein